MLRIEIHKSKSKKFYEAVSIAEFFGASFDGKKIEMFIGDDEMLIAYKKITYLLSIASKWKTTKAWYKDKPVDLYRFTFNVYKNIAECATAKHLNGHSDHCNMTPDQEGWGCKHIDNILCNNSGPGTYENSGKYWYNFGAFNSKGEWVVNKKEILQRVQKKAESEYLEICPFFDKQLLFEKITNLPKIIIPDNYNYRLHYVEKFEDGKSILQANNIRHIRDLSEAPGLMSTRLKYKIKSALQFTQAHDIDLPENIKDKLQVRATKHTTEELVTMLKAFDNNGICQN